MKKAPGRAVNVTIAMVVVLAIITSILLPDMTRAQFRNMKLWVEAVLLSTFAIVLIANWLAGRK
jgi:hypothetical protein